MGVVLAGVAVSFWPGAAPRFEYDRAAVDRGAWHRVLTGQLAHHGARMAAADLGTVLLAGMWVERRSPRLCALALAGAALAVGLGVHFAAPDVARYRGASGLAMAIVAAAGTDLLRHGRRGAPRVLAAGVLALLALKVGLELATGAAIGPRVLPPGVELVPLVHAVGGLAGVAAALATPRRAANGEG